jgi:hypothetical protein
MALSTKIKVLILNPGENLNGVTWWRMYQPFHDLERQYGDEIEITYNRGELQPQDFLQYDVYFFLRPYMPLHLHLLQELKRYARHFKNASPVILDFDDDNKNLPLYHLNYQDEGVGYQITRQALPLASEIWVSTPPIAESYKPHAADAPSIIMPNAGAARFCVIPNAIDTWGAGEWNFNHRQPDAIKQHPAGVVWWGGSAGHHHDLQAFEAAYYKLEPKIQEMHWCGYLPPYSLDLNKTRYYPAIFPTLQYFEVLESTKPNYIWKPLQNIAFNDAKSNIQYLQATQAGALCLTNYAGRPGWEYATKDIITDEAKAFDLWYEAVKDIRVRYDLFRSSKLRYDSIVRCATGQIKSPDA